MASAGSKETRRRFEWIGNWTAWLAAAVLLCCAVPSGANTAAFATPPNLNFDGKPVNARAVFGMDDVSGQITVSILNLQVDPTAVSQLVAGVAFTLSNLQGGKLSGTLASSTAPAFSIGANGEPTQPTTTTPTEWVVQPVAAARILNITQAGLFLCKICTSGAMNGPDQLIAGGPAENGGYSGANGGISGNKSHNPFLLGSGDPYTPMFVIDVPGVTAATAVASVTFTFGTTFGQYQAAGRYQPIEQYAVPEPGALALTLAGSVPLAIYWRLKSKAASVGVAGMGERQASKANASALRDSRGSMTASQ